MERSGQMIFEFLVAAVLFFAVVIYTLTALGSSLAGASEQSQADVTQASAFAISELLVTQAGVWPDSWSPDPKTANVQLGLADDAGYPNLNATKLANLAGNCTFPADLLPLLNLDSRPVGTYHYNITVQKAGAATPLATCGTQPPALSQGTARRLARLPTGELVFLDVAVW